MITEEIRQRMTELRDPVYAQFQLKLMPGIREEQVLGIRMPMVRQLAKDYAKDPRIGEFLEELPHKYYDEYNLHGAILCLSRDYDETVKRLDAFLPYVDNWATCDLLRPKAFAKNPDRLTADIDRWLESGETYTVRFAMEMLMTFYLDDAFDPKYPERLSRIRSGEYYVNMMLSWYYATALAKQWESILPYLTEHRLAPWVHNKTIQKAIESYRIPEERKAMLRTLRIKNGL